MQQTQCLVQNIDQHLQSGLLLSSILTVKSCLSQFNIPVAVAVPQEVIYLLNGNAQLILFKIISNLSNQGIQLGKHPLISDGQLIHSGQFVPCVLTQIHKNIAAGIPQLIGKVTHCFAALYVETHVVTGGIASNHIHTQRIAAVLFNHFQRINAIAKTLGHLSALIITHQAVNQHGVEGCLTGMLTAGEDHSGNPEENDIVAGNQDICGIEVVQILGLFGPAKGLKGPQSRAEPGIQHIGVTLNVSASALFALAGILTGDGYMTTLCAGPGGNLMTPPKLTGNTPIADIFHPVGVGLAETLGNELCLALIYNTQRFFGKGFHLHKPLGGDDWLNIIMAAVAGANIVRVILNLNKVSLRFQIGYNSLTGLIAIHTLILSAILVHNSVVIQHADHFQIMAQTNLEVVGVVGRCHFHAAGAEFHLSVVISNNGNFLIHKRENHLFAYDSGIALIVGVDANATVTQHRFRTGSGNDHFTAAVSQGIANMPQMPGLIHILYFSIRQSSYAVRTPVDNTASLINESLFIQGYKHLANGIGTALVHSKSGSVPVAGRAQLLLLFHNTVAVLMLPVPYLLQELLTSQIVASQAILTQFFLNFDLRCNTCMVYTGEPQGVVALHTLKTNQRILQRCIHSVTHMKLSGYIGRGHNNGEGLGISGLIRLKMTVLLPHFINFVFHLLGLINLG